MNASAMCRSEVRQEIDTTRLEVIDLEIDQLWYEVKQMLLIEDWNEMHGTVSAAQERLNAIVTEVRQSRNIMADRLPACDSLQKDLLQVELKFMRGATATQLATLRDELAELEAPDRPSSAPELSIEAAALQTMYAEFKNRSGTFVTGPGSLKGSALDAAQGEEDEDKANMQSAAFAHSEGMRFSQASGIPVSFIPPGRYRVGMPNGARMVRMESEIPTSTSGSQWHHLSRNFTHNADNMARLGVPQRRFPTDLAIQSSRAASTNSASPLGKSAAAVDSRSPTDEPFVACVPEQEVDLPGFFVTTYPLRVSDWKRLRQAFPDLPSIPDAVLEGHRFNFVPSFVAGVHFGFTRHAKDVLDDEDDPVLELPYWTALRIAEAVGGSIPSWQQWEAAARGSDAFLYPNGNDLDLRALTFDEPAAWQLELTEITSGSDGNSVMRSTVEGTSVRLRNMGVHAFAKSPFGLRLLHRFGFEWNACNFDVYHPNGPSTHLLRTLTDYFTQYIFEGGDVSGNHRAFSGPVLPLFALPNRFVRTAAFRIAFPATDSSFVHPPVAGLAVEGETDERLRRRVHGGGGGVLQGCPLSLGYGVGAKLSEADVALWRLLLLFGNGFDRVLLSLGEPECVTPHKFQRGVNWCYYSLGVMLCYQNTSKRPLVREMQLWNSTQCDLVTEEWNTWSGKLDATLRLRELTAEIIKQHWGAPHGERSGAVIYLRSFPEFMPSDSPAGSPAEIARRAYASTSLSFEFGLGSAGAVSRVVVRMG
eukprot:TRINITY_DN13494_c0_g1_i1.p1 TRINITY_DN13494_c0_g1~~TRINITY_DN13494_c0_g1_i1.p1  ORF type:complete len:760 (+),score=107.29 TRINITY_DN13494_c0_g1_i1:42-2321(+)